jgi:tetratricopeptide (TPR) repeat protein
VRLQPRLVFLAAVLPATVLAANGFRYQAECRRLWERSQGMAEDGPRTPWNLHEFFTFPAWSTRASLWKVTRPNLERAIEYFRQATIIDPRLAIAYAGLADCYDVLPITSDFPPRKTFRKAEQAAMQALKIDRGLAETHSVLPSVRFWHSWDWCASEEHSHHAIARNSSYARAHMRYGHMLSNTGRHDEAIAEIDLARRLDPFSPIINTLCAEFRFHARRYDEVLPLLARTLEIDPHFWVAQIVSVKIHQFLERYDEALTAAQKASQFSGGNTEATALIGYTYALMGRSAEAERVLQELHALISRSLFRRIISAQCIWGSAIRRRRLSGSKKRTRDATFIWCSSMLSPNGTACAAPLVFRAFFAASV